MLWCFQWLPYLLVSADEDPVDFASNVFVPVLAFHDLRDPVVPYKSGKILYDRFPPSLVHLITHEGADHAAALGTSRPDGKDELRRFIGIK